MERTSVKAAAHPTRWHFLFLSLTHTHTFTLSSLSRRDSHHARTIQRFCGAGSGHVRVLPGAELARVSRETTWRLWDAARKSGGKWRQPRLSAKSDHAQTNWGRLGTHGDDQCRANLAHIRQSRSDDGLGRSQVLGKSLNPLTLLPSHSGAAAAARVSPEW